MKLLPVHLIVGVVLVADPAFADDLKAAREHAVLGKTHFDLGRFEEALGEYQRAYELFQAPPLLFNLGKCHLRLKNYERAVFFFERFLGKDPDSTARKRAEALLAEARERLAAERAKADEKAAESSVDLSPAQISTPAEPSPPLVQASDKRRKSAPLYERWWLWTAAGGVAAAAVLTLALTTSRRTVPPKGSLGISDQR